MEFKLEESDGAAVVVLCCESLDPTNGERFKSFVGAAAEANSKVVVDMSALRFIDSSGFGALLTCQQEAAGAGGDLKICGAVDSVQALFKLIRLHRVFDMFETREEAVRAFGA